MKAVAWMTHHEEPQLYPTHEEAALYCNDEEPIGLVPQDEIERAVRVALIHSGVMWTEQDVSYVLARLKQEAALDRMVKHAEDNGLYDL